MAERYIYVDESKRSGYVLAAVTVTDVAAVRRVIRDLILPGQRRLHMKREQSGRRGTIVSALVQTGIEAIVYDAARRYPTELGARRACLAAVVADLAALGGPLQLVIEQDDSLVRSDRHELYGLVRRARISEIIEYRHQRAAEDPLLALPDVVAWCWVRSGDWRRRISPILTATRTV
ncbi:MAG TPA: hypothetical protein VHB02_06320 [Acidimicrobiales bacterium]|nr:hypothetical protein [Acidimicrobiales bacterium]